MASECVHDTTTLISDMMRRVAIPSKKWQKYGDGKKSYNPSNNKQFYPYDKLKDIFTKENITKVLENGGEYCRKTENSFTPKNHDGVKRADRMMGEKPNASPEITYFSVFELLVFIRQPMLILSLPHERFSDACFANVGKFFREIKS